MQVFLTVTEHSIVDIEKDFNFINTQTINIIDINSFINVMTEFVNKLNINNFSEESKFDKASENVYIINLVFSKLNDTTNNIHIDIICKLDSKLETDNKNDTNLKSKFINSQITDLYNYYKSDMFLLYFDYNISNEFDGFIHQIVNLNAYKFDKFLNDYKSDLQIDYEVINSENSIHFSTKIIPQNLKKHIKIIVNADAINAFKILYADKFCINNLSGVDPVNKLLTDFKK